MKNSIKNFPTTTRVKNSLAKLSTITKGVFAAAIILTTNHVQAQEEDSTKASAAQVSFGFPMGSHGAESMNYHNKYSFNCLYGVNGGVDVAEIGGIVNFNKGSVNGFQLAGVSNVTTLGSKGVIVSGVLNYSGKSSEGVQVSTVNVVNGNFSGVQVGVYNHVRKLKGVQLGVFNFVDSLEGGVPIGVINIVRHGGYSALELTGGDALYGNLNYKIGVEKFYTIFKMGYSKFNENNVYSYGFGFGTKLQIAPKHAVSIDLSHSTIVYDEQWGKPENNHLSKADFNYNYALTKKLSIIAGPSFNVYRSKVNVGDEFGTLATPNNIYTDENADRKISMWIGFNAGLSLKL